MSAIAPLARASRLAAVPRRLLRLRSDAALAERFAAGDEAAFAVLYERHRSSVLAVCIGVLGSQHDAEDAAQEVFTALAVALRGERPRELRPWLVRVARNAAIDAKRRRRSGVAGADVVDPYAIADSGIRAELDSVLAAIRELPESQRTALLLRELAGHSYREIAVLLGVDEEAVRGLIARARVGLRHHRQAAELPCAVARQSLAAEPDGRRRNAVVRRHVRQCGSCQAYRNGLRADAKALHALAPVPAGGLVGGAGALIGATAKGVLAGGALTQAGAACAVSICSVGGIVLLAPHLVPHPVHHGRGAAAHHRVATERRRSAATGRGRSAAVVATSMGVNAAVSDPAAGDGAAVVSRGGLAGWDRRWSSSSSSSAGRGAGSGGDRRQHDAPVSLAGAGSDGQRSGGGRTDGNGSGDPGSGGASGPSRAGDGGGGGAGSGAGDTNRVGGSGDWSGGGSGSGSGGSWSGSDGGSSGPASGGDGASPGGSAGGSTATAEWVKRGDSTGGGVAGVGGAGGAGGAGGSGQSAPADQQPATGSADGLASGSTVSDAGSGGTASISSGG
jgi:RNA polymerase sigma factor (sigma-70 family)